MASMATLGGMIFRPPASIFVTMMTAASLAGLTMIGINEVRGKHQQYSKLAAENNSGAKIGSKAGMTVAYLPAFMFTVTSVFIFPVSYGEDSRFFLLRSALSIHFLKRLLEIWYVHKYSRSMTIEVVVTISASYFMFTLTIIYAQSLSLGLKPPSIPLHQIGLLLFVVGTCGNSYHHYLLSTLRRNGEEKEYKMPKGGLFSLVICPHYMFEVVTFWGFALMAQTLYALSFTVGSVVYLLGRSYATRNWYASKFDDFPDHVKALIPFVF